MRTTYPRRLAVSANGRFVAILTAARLVPADTNGRDDIYVLDRASGAVSLESADAAPIAGSTPAISATGRFLVYETDADTESQRIVVLRDRDTGAMRLLQPGGRTPNGSSRDPSISGTGRYVAFASSATNLADGSDSNSHGEDVYVADVTSMSFRRVGLEPAGAQSPSGSSFAPAISEDGRFVAFVSTAASPAAGNVGARTNTYLHDLQAGTTALVSVAPSGAAANGSSYRPAINTDGRYVAFVSEATNLGRRLDHNGVPDVYIRDMIAGVTELVSRTPSGQPGNGPSDFPSVSGDGRIVVFQSDASDLTCGEHCPVGDRDINLVADIFRYDRQTGLTERISRGPTPWMEPSIGPAMDRTGALIAFMSRHPIDRSDDRHDYDLFVWTRQVGR